MSRLKPRVTVAHDESYNSREFFNLAPGKKSGPIVTEQLHRSEYLLDEKLNKNQVVIIPLANGLLHQMLQGQRGQRADEERYGEFVVRCYGRIVGGSSFDGLADDKILRVRLLWSPKGFQEQSVSEILTTFKPRIEIMKAD